MNAQRDKECYYIICVDDDDTFLNSLSMVLPDKLSKQYPEFDYRFEFVNNVADFFQLISDLKNDDEKVALIISDQKMLDMSGIELLEKTIKDLPDTMRMLLTGYGGLDSAKYAINNRLLDQYVTKPIDDYDNFMSIMSNMIKNFHLQLLKVKQEKEIKKQNEALKTANGKIEKMLRSAEEVAFFAKDVKRLDLDEILNLTMKEIPMLFNCDKVSIFLLQKEGNISKLRLARSTHIENNIELIMDDKSHLPVREIVTDSTGKVVEERELNKGQYTPMQKAIEQDSLLIIPDVQGSELRLLRKNELGKACIIIPFIVNPGTAEQSVRDIIGIVNIGGALNVSGIEIDNNDEMEFIKYKASLIQEIIGANINNAQIFAETKKMAITDSLTGLYNNRMLNEFLSKEIERIKRYVNVFSVVVCDVDNFKEINDSYGHLTGDVVLRQLAALLSRTKRTSDILFRYGGEEFVFILPETDAKQTYPMIERIRKGVEETKFNHLDQKITLSFGVTQCSSTERYNDAKEVLNKADMAMYAAKAKGKNRVEIFVPEKD